MANSTRGNKVVPDGWRLIRLGDVAEVQKGVSFTSKELVPGNVPVIAGGRAQAYYHHIANRPGETITVSASGAHAGFVAFHDMPIFATDCTTVRARTAFSDTRFIHHALKHDEGVLYRRRSGSAQPHVYPKDIASSRMSLPPLPEQRAIAAVLDSIDEAIERTEAVIVATERLRDALLHRLLTRGVPSWHSEWKEVRGLGTIPASWEVVRLGEVAESITSGSRGWSRYFRSSGAFFVRSQNITASGIDHADAIFVDPPSDGETKRTRISRGDILISITGEPGKTTIASEDIGQAFVSQHVALVRLRDRRLSCFASRFLQGQKGQDQFRQMAYGQTRPGLSLLNIGEAKIALPQLSEQRVMVLMMDSVDEAIERGRTETEMLQSLKASATDALLTGRVRVRQSR